MSDSRHSFDAEVGQARLPVPSTSLQVSRTWMPGTRPGMTMF